MNRKLRALAATVLLAVTVLIAGGCNENIPGDPDYYSCQFFGDHCDK